MKNLGDTEGHNTKTPLFLFVKNIREQKVSQSSDHVQNQVRKTMNPKDMNMIDLVNHYYEIIDEAQLTFKEKPYHSL